MENNIKIGIGVILVIICITLWIQVWRRRLKKRQYISFREFMEVAQGYLKAEQDREGMSHLHWLDFALMHYEFYLNERKVDQRKVEEITKYRFRVRGLFGNFSQKMIEEHIKQFL